MRNLESQNRRFRNSKLEEKKDTLYDVLLRNDEKEINDFLMRNGKKKSYCPVQFHTEKVDIKGDETNSLVIQK